MENNRVIKIVATFSRKEMTRFHELVQSPYFIKHKDVRKLVKYLNKIYPNFNGDTCNRFVLSKKLFPGKDHDQSKIAIVFTYTYRALEIFLIQEEFAQEEIYQKVLSIQSLRKRNQLKYLERTIRILDNLLEKHPFKDVDFYRGHYHLASERDNYQLLSDMAQRDNSLQQKQQLLDTTYLIEKLRDACEMQVRTNILKVNYSTRLLEAVLQEVAENLEEYRKIPPIFIFYQIYLMLTQKEEQYYFEVVQTLDEQKEVFPKETLQGIYNYLQNYCIAQINKGNGQFMNELFKLYQNQLENALILEDFLMFEWHYKNIVTVGLRVGATDWVARFIEKYKRYLPEEVRENAYSFNLASYYYAKQELGKVLRLLTQVEYNHIRYSFGAKTLLLRTYFDLEEDEVLLSQIDAFWQYLYRNRYTNPSRIEGLQNFVRYLRKLVLLRTQKEVMDKDKLKLDLEKLSTTVAETHNIINKDWLVEKIGEF